MSEESKLLEKISLKQNINNIRRVMGLISQLDKSFVAWNLAAVTISTVKAYAGLLLTAYIVNGIADGMGYMEMIKMAVSVTVGLSLSASILSLVNKRIDIKSQMISEKYNALQQEKIMGLDFSMIDSPKLKDLRERIRKDNNWGAGIFSMFWEVRGAFQAVLDWIGALVAGFSMFAYFDGGAYVKAGIVAAGFGVITIIGIKWYRHFMGMYYYSIFHEPTKEERNDILNYSWDFMYGTTGYSYKNGKDVRIYNGYDVMKYWVYDRMQTKPYYNYCVKRPAVSFAGGNAVRSGLYALEMTAAYLIITLLALSKNMPVGFVILYAGALTNMLHQTVNIIISCFDISLTAKKQVSILDLLSLSAEMYQGSLPLEKRRDNEYEIEFRNVSFKYPGSNEYALKNLSMKLKVGEKLAIVGRNGSGKTTMIKLLCRLYDPDEGEILVNGVDIRKFRHDEYSTLFSVVFQDYVLLAFMLAENVAIGKEYDTDKVTGALRDAGFGGRLSQMGEKGIENYLYKDYTDEGIEISGGEAQKIAIARAIYKDAPFVLLDEPTAALDPIAESEIYTNFDKVVGDKTAVYISHRLSSCKFCDKIAVFDQGQLVQVGNHEELLADQAGVYASLWNAQAKYYETV